MSKEDGMRLFRPALALSLLVAGLTPAVASQAAASKPQDDVTVIAVIDSGFSPYHQDFLASEVPADIKALPLTKAPDTWVPGFPKRSAFAAYSPLSLTLDGEASTNMDALHTKDKAAWASVKQSTPTAIDYRWIPGTKVIGALTFGAGGTIYGTGGAEHGMGTTSVAVGNHHGACPSCLLVFIQYADAASAEAALTWVHHQPWIDAVSNSYGFSTGIVARDRIYNGTDVVTERAASERGQTTFFSAGNGVENAFTVPNSTLKSSQEGPDWVVTVGATDPNGKDYTGTGKPADIAGIGVSYPSAYGSTTVSDGKNFSGTSNATPQIAGTYGQALWTLRKNAAGASRTQAKGYVVGSSVTAKALRSALFLSAVPTAGGYTDGLAGLAQTPAVADSRFAAEGYGTFRGALNKDGGVAAEVARVVNIAHGGKPAARPDGEKDWFVVDSWCRQMIWGAWTQGSYLNDAKTPVPNANPVAWPTRTAIQEACPLLARSSSPK